MDIIRYIKHAGKFIADSDYRFRILANLGFYNKMEDREYLERTYHFAMKKSLDLENPQTFNEKLQWLKLYDRRPEYTVMVDKCKVREYIAELLGEEYLIPLLGMWDNPDEIDFDALPNQFVLKCNHNSGLGMCICRDKSKLDVAKVKKELGRGLKQDYYLTGREWPYKNVPRKIICERYMIDDKKTDINEELSDYKVLCFNGTPKLVEIHKGRYSGHHTQDFYDVDWNKTDFMQPGYPISDSVITKPVFADEMFELSVKLTRGIPHVRVDWYYAEGHLYFSEMTFYDGSGFCPFVCGHDENIGSWLKLPEKDERIVCT